MSKVTKYLTEILTTALLLISANSAAEQQPPNILLLVAEDMSSHLKAFGDDIAITPNLDALAKTSIIYPNTFTTAGVCAPSRTAIITGVHQASIGGQHMRARDFKTSAYRAVPPEKLKAFPELLRQQGYYTFVSSKLDYQFSEIAPNTGPFTIWDYEGDKPNWHGRGKDQPFFGMYHFNISHESQLFPQKISKNLAKGLVKNDIKAAQVPVPPYFPDTVKVRETIAQLYNNVTAMDKQIGNLLQQLEADGLADNTIVVWTTDHGDGLPRGKREVYDSGIKVPLIVHWPEQYKPEGISIGSIDQQLISLVDLAPSILTMAGASLPDYLHGQARLARTDIKERDYVYASKDRLDEQYFYERAVRNQHFKYIRNYLPNKPGGTRLAYREKMPLMQELWHQRAAGNFTPEQEFWFANRPAEELYDIVNDPFEINNLADSTDHQASLTEMQNALADWQSKVTDLSAISEIELANRSWPNGQQPLTQVPSININNNALITLHCVTPGASIGYKFNDGPWRLYTTAIHLPEDATVTAKAVRYGWQESQAVTSSKTSKL